MAISSASDSPFYNSRFPQGAEDNRVVSAGANGNKIVSEGDTSKFTDSKKTAAMGKDQFLKLLVTQLQNQDPLKPSTDQEFAAQLAQFSSLESSQNIEKQMTGFASDIKSFLQSQSTGLQASASTAATSLIGKEVLVDDSELNYDGYGTVPLAFSLDNPKAVKAIVIEDKEGRQLAKVDVSNDSGSNIFAHPFDGVGIDGKKIPAGTYKARIVDAVGSDVGFAMEQGTVDSISYKNGETMVRLASKDGGKVYTFGKVRQVGGFEQGT